MQNDSLCKWCSKPIRWVNIESTRRAIDYAPSPKGTIVVIGTDTAMICPSTHRAASAYRLYELHADTCEKSEEKRAFDRRQMSDRRARKIREGFSIVRNKDE